MRGLKKSQESHLFWDVSKRSLRCLSQWRSDWDLSETSHAGWVISKFNKGFRFLLCGIDIYSKYVWVISLKNKKGTTITNAFLKILDESNRKPNKIRVNKGSEFYNKKMKSFLQNNGIEMYSTHNDGKSIITKRFIRTLTNKIYKYTTSVSKMCILIN